MRRRLPPCRTRTLRRSCGWQCPSARSVRRRSSWLTRARARSSSARPSVRCGGRIRPSPPVWGSPSTRTGTRFCRGTRWRDRTSWRPSSPMFFALDAGAGRWVIASEPSAVVGHPFAPPGSCRFPVYCRPGKSPVFPRTAEGIDAIALYRFARTTNG